jgi:hypothetical protein
VYQTEQTLAFDEKLRKVNYLEDEKYDDFNYIFIKRDEYEVTETFPKIVAATLPIGITKASYEIDLSAIQEFKVAA